MGFETGDLNLLCFEMQTDPAVSAQDHSSLNGWWQPHTKARADPGAGAQELTCKTPGTQLCARQPPHPHHPVAAGSVGARLFALIRTCQRCRMQMCVYFIYFYKSYTHIWDLCATLWEPLSVCCAVCQVAGKQDANGQRNKRWFSVHGSEWLQLWQMFQGGRKPDLFFIL